MKKIIIGLICGLVTTGALCMPVAAEETETFDPTFITEQDDSKQSAGLWVGKSLLLAGNNLSTDTNVQNGLLLVAGNNLNLSGNSEYGFVFGNIVKITGDTKRDLYVAGNSVTLSDSAVIGRDVFVASGELRVETDLLGDLSATADRVVIDKGIEIDGNVNLNVDTIEFGENVVINGKLSYNDNAHVNGLENVTSGATETYHLQEISNGAMAAAIFYNKFLSIAGLFLVMALILALYPKVRNQVQSETSVSRFGTNAAIGIGALIIVPIIAIFAFLTIVAAPLGVIALLIYGVCIYLAQGFSGYWLGHVIVEKLFKAKGNVFIEALIGIIVLGLLALIPFVGAIIGFLSLIFGLGLIVGCVKPSKTVANSEPNKKLVASRAKAGKANK